MSYQQGKHFHLNPPPSTRAAEVFLQQVRAQENRLDKPCLLTGAVLDTAVNLGFFSEHFL